MRSRLLGVLVSSSMLAAGAVFAADTSTTTTTTAPNDSAMPPASSSTTTTTTTAPATLTHTGVIKSYDEDSHMLILKDGARFIVDPGVKANDLDRGKAVSLTYRMDGDQKVVTEYR